jgi:hypothetical protein
MRRFLIISVVVLGVVALAIYGLVTGTKSYSPEGNVTFSSENLKVNVFYNRPTKKGREIFGGLVPFGKVWRTGANEATVFETSQALDFGSGSLPPGKYSLWTIPNEQSWKVIFNSDIPMWGLGFDGHVLRKPEKDVLTIEAPVVMQEKEFEQFTISVEKMGEEMELIFIWDKTLVAAPFTDK